MDSNNRNIIIVLVGGFIVAILVALMVQAALSGGKEKEVDVVRTQVLVAAKQLSVGHEIVDGDFKWQTWPQDSLFPGAIIRDGEQRAIEAATGKTVRSLSEGQPVHMNVFVEDDRGDFLSANVSKGMRAVGISVKSYTLADRLIRPGDYVDVLLTYRVRVNARTNPEAQSVVNRYATETVIKNIRVLAIDKEDTKAVDAAEEEGGKKKKSKTKKTATLTVEVTPTQAEQLLLATEMGDIGLALRSIGDSADIDDDNTTTDVGMSNVLTELSDMKDGGGKNQEVRIYSGSNMEKADVRRQAVEQNLNFSVEENQSLDEAFEGDIIFSPRIFGGSDE